MKNVTYSSLFLLMRMLEMKVIKLLHLNKHSVYYSQYLDSWLMPITFNTKPSMVDLQEFTCLTTSRLVILILIRPVVSVFENVNVSIFAPQPSIGNPLQTWCKKPSSLFKC